MIRFTAFRTWMSSNGGTSRFIVMYQVRSPGSACSIGRSVGSVAYFCRTWGGGWLARLPSSSPVEILLKMSSVFESISMSTPST